MILQSLVAYYEALARNGVVQRPGWAYVRVSYKVILRADGTIRDIVSVKKAEKRGKKEVLVPWEIEAPEQVVRASGIRANFLCDTAAYLLGYSQTDKNAAKKMGSITRSASGNPEKRGLSPCKNTAVFL